jgi:hypothetical protein
MIFLPANKEKSGSGAFGYTAAIAGKSKSN